MKDIKFWHRVQLPDGTYTPGEVYHGDDGENWPTTRFGLPEKLNDLDVIDIGAWDGFFSFEAEKRKAKSVLATDATHEEGGNHLGTDGFQYIKKQLNSKVEFEHLNIENMKHSKQYDLVLCFGVLYHLKSPLIAMENLSKLTKPNGICLLETTICHSNDEPILEYRPKFANDPSNYFYPSIKWIELVGKEVGFKNIKVHYKIYERATFILEKE